MTVQANDIKEEWTSDLIVLQCSSVPYKTETYRNKYILGKHLSLTRNNVLLRPKVCYLPEGVRRRPKEKNVCR